MKQGIIILLIFLLHISCAFGIRISQKKCQEYDAIVPPISVLNNVVDVDNADPEIFPFMAKIVGYPGGYYNGLLISENFILTIGHSDPLYRDDITVLLGDYVNISDVAPQQFSIVERICSPQIDTNYPDNLTLLKLNASVEFNRYIRPVCLSQPEDNIRQPLLEVSWGLDDLLRKQERNLLSNGRCYVTHGGVVAGPTRMCASRRDTDCARWTEINRVLTRFTNACALLNLRRQSNELVAVKVRSSHFSCGQGNPEEYVRIAPYIDWIERNVWPGKSGGTGADYFSLSTYIVLLLAGFVSNNYLV